MLIQTNHTVCVISLDHWSRTFLKSHKKIRILSICSMPKNSRGECRHSCAIYLHSQQSSWTWIPIGSVKYPAAWEPRERWHGHNKILSGMGTEGTGTRRHPEFRRHWGGGAGLPATKLGVVRPWELITSSTPTPHISTTFLPPSCQPSKRTEQTPPFQDFRSCAKLS